jgi:hypothetical protein
MPEFIVAIDHITYYAVQAEDEVTAIDLVLEGQGEEVSSDTRDAYITEYQSSDPRRDSWYENGPSQYPWLSSLLCLAALLLNRLATRDIPWHMGAVGVWMPQVGLALLWDEWIGD